MAEHAHGGDPNLAHHFESMDQQVNAAKLGMWLFLATEVLLFAGLFCGYAVYRANNPEVFAYASTFLSVPLGALNTVILLLSSFTVALAVRASALGQRRQTSILLVLTLLGAAGFLGVKAVEYASKFEEHELWGIHYQPQTAREPGWAPGMGHGDEGADHDPDAEHHGEEAGPAEEVDPRVAALLEARPTEATPWQGAEPLQDRSLIPAPADAPSGLLRADEAAAPTQAELIRNVHLFFGIYFVMTGTHGLHVIIGAIAIIWVLRRNMRGDFDAHYNTPVDLVGLYWHLVDLIWIFLFPLLYLINVQGGGHA